MLTATTLTAAILTMTTLDYFGYTTMAMLLRLYYHGFATQEKDAVGQRVARKGDLVVYLFACWPELLEQAKGWMGSAAGPKLGQSATECP